MTKREWALFIECAIRVQAVLVTVLPVAYFVAHFSGIAHILNSGNPVSGKLYNCAIFAFPVMIDLSAMLLLWLIAPRTSQWLLQDLPTKSHDRSLLLWQSVIIAAIGLYLLCPIFLLYPFFGFWNLHFYNEPFKTIYKSYFGMILISRLLFGAFFVVSCHRIAGWLGEIGKVQKPPKSENDIHTLS